MTNQKLYPDRGSDVSSVWNFCARFSNVISRGSHIDGVTKGRLFCQADFICICNFSQERRSYNEANRLDLLWIIRYYDFNVKCIVCLLGQERQFDQR